LKVWTYVITVDAGAAPNFEHGLTTLTVCKPRIRKAAERGDLVLAFNSSKLNPDEPHSVRWAGLVTEVVSLEDYWTDKRFEGKKPGKSPKPDNIYRPTGTGELKQVSNTTHGPQDFARDVNGENALVLSPTWYFGPEVAVLPASFNLRMIGGRRGHRCIPITDRTWSNLERWLNLNVPNSNLLKSFSARASRCSPPHSNNIACAD
jgi:hypothetical protein